MTADQTNTEAIQAFTYAMTHEDIDGVMKLWDTEGEWEVMATGETFKGLEEIRQFASRSVAARDHATGEGLLPFNVYSNSEGTKLCWEYVHEGEVTDQWPASTHKVAKGTRFVLPIVLICEIHEGKLVKIREYFDLLTLLEPDKAHKLYS
jgi:ketosteroid isomerase-like protein